MTITEQDIKDLKALSLKHPVCEKMLELLMKDSLENYLAMKTQMAQWRFEINASPATFEEGDERKFDRVFKVIDKLDDFDSKLLSMYNKLTTDQKQEAAKPKKQSAQVAAVLAKK